MDDERDSDTATAAEPSTSTFNASEQPAKQLPLPTLHQRLSVAVAGDSGIGKTTILRRLAGDLSPPSTIPATIDIHHLEDVFFVADCGTAETERIAAERKAAIEEQKRIREEASAGRKKYYAQRNETRSKLGRKTRKGQPVMGNLIDHMLSRIQAGTE
ncbi:hypothetical protein BDK51DRAFT_48358 [Blyttiomyces helicus]|uniref:rRNA-processing protein FYV7 n=1 Tax=Blyttiomyces helicus TaxID=388810 RepID=A0A4V1IRC8_9FUNG|nr:hypothetical protein BDK51DRAFT_48358 [Blyttiomyces helicus]|eukprot:RKO89607.1 hypothetical protein BDK51DRAFT_48358 [Blyttiomyces helicus]